MTLSRRRFLVISAAASCVGTGTSAKAQWSGRALGAPAAMQLVGLSAAEAAPIFAAVEAEITRLERIFSLYLPNSELTRLNATGRLNAPSADMLAVLGLSDTVYRATGGAFDPTIQPLWKAYADALTKGETPDPNAAHQHVDWPLVRFDTDAVVFGKPDMALTLNGVAQGYITDRVNQLLEAHGLTDILIDVGEIAARGTGPDQRPWQVGIQDPGHRIVQRVQLRNRALATSAPGSLLLDPDSNTGHILHPRLSIKNSLVAVSSPRADIADALSTAGILLSSDALQSAIAAFPDTHIISLQEQGSPL